MVETVRISSVHFSQFKVLARNQLHLEHLSILVGPNNSGKSTIIGAVRALACALRVARSRAPKSLDLSDGPVLGYRISEESLPISLENIHTDYGARDSKVTFNLSNKNKLHLVFPSDEGCLLVPEVEGGAVTSAAKFRRYFPLKLAVVPVLGPVEHREIRRERDTVVSWLSTHRASRHFRSYWYHFPEYFENFAELVRGTWPGMEVQPPEISDVTTGELSMFCLEERMTRELYWAGFGFQVWCQLLTHLCRAHESSLVVIDEPEVYLHPDVQRQLIGILRDLGPDVLLATHSTEIMSEADPCDIVLIDKRRQSFERLRNVDGVQRAMDSVGSIQNITLTSLARNRRVLFVEGEGDFRLLRRFARRLGRTDLAAGFGITALESGGFGSWQRITTLAEGIGQALGTQLMIGAVYDRDYYCAEEIKAVRDSLSHGLALSHVHTRKEIENYLLIPAALDRAITRAAADRVARTGDKNVELIQSMDLLDAITSPLKDYVQSQLIARRTNFLRSTGRDAADLTRETLILFSERWDNLDTRLEIVPGKEVIRLFRDKVRETLGISLSDARIVDAIHRDEIPADLQQLLVSLDEFRAMQQ